MQRTGLVGRPLIGGVMPITITVRKLEENMKTIEVYRHPTIEAQAVKVGFCMPAFFFGVIWMLISRL